MKTGKTLKTFRGHTSYINTAVYSYSESQVLTGSSDGTIKIFSTSTTDCLNTISLSNGGIGIHTRPVIGLLKMGDEFVVCNQSGWIYFVNEEGKVTLY